MEAGTDTTADREWRQEEETAGGAHTGWEKQQGSEERAAQWREEKGQREEAGTEETSSSKWGATGFINEW